VIHFFVMRLKQAFQTMKKPNDNLRYVILKICLVLKANFNPQEQTSMNDRTDEILHELSNIDSSIIELSQKAEKVTKLLEQILKSLQKIEKKVI